MNFNFGNYKNLVFKLLHNIKAYLYDNPLTELPAGTYKLEISMQYAVSSLLNNPRTAVFSPNAYGRVRTEDKGVLSVRIKPLYSSV
ncbi:MAG: hypothetical protein LBB41_01600 [Prevotellaceae bacterium]|nr:hypothetical protein [Prevotellaceae bacterium]